LPLWRQASVASRARRRMRFTCGRIAGPMVSNCSGRVSKSREQSRAVPSRRGGA
jgi:hypothetical protein